MIKKKVGSITLAVGLITMGVLLFAQNFMDIPVKDIYRYWPVLLIGLGLEMVLYMVLYSRNNNEVKLSVDGLCIVFIIILGLISNGVKLINIEKPGHMFFGFNGDSIVDGIRYKSEISEKYTKENISGSFDLKELQAKNEFGDIKILPANGKGIKLEAEVWVKCNDEAKAREYAKNAIEIKEGEVTSIQLNNPENWDRDAFSKAQVDLVIYVPKKVKVDARGGFGDISVEGIEGNCVLENKNGEIDVVNISGDVDVENSFGDIEVSGIAGKAEITNKNGQISAEGITGSAAIENHFGSIEAVKIGGDLKVVNNNGRITVENVNGKADLTNSFGDINVSRVNGDVNVENKNGRIEAEDISSNVQLKNAFGDINYASANLDNSDIYAKTKFGSIECDKPLQLNKDGQDTVAQGKLGTGQYKIEITTNNGSINIE